MQRCHLNRSHCKGGSPVLSKPFLCFFTLKPEIISDTKSPQWTGTTPHHQHRVPLTSSLRSSSCLLRNYDGSETVKSFFSCMFPPPHTQTHSSSFPKSLMGHVVCPKVRAPGGYCRRKCQDAHIINEFQRRGS